ncbi:Tubulin monoglycylase TTLL3 [Bagarius yarrelli]|uniref:Tubulin monoglycylase TTLL3 n=1 Tax=Bagarius yarrelli TaxID=175774 RepID=A0A556TR36_BAGYA|nr:Tubulin monoglycylase TTLL3 [Bagarius yarrelli]
MSNSSNEPEVSEINHQKYLVAQHALLVAVFCRHFKFSSERRDAAQKVFLSLPCMEQQLIPDSHQENNHKLQQRHSLQQTKIRRRGVSFPVIHIDKLRAAKALATKAVKEKKVFSVQGPYPVIRAGLRARGWVERRLPRCSIRAQDHETEATEENDSSNDDDRGLDREDDADDMYNLMSRLVHHEMTNFYWTTKKDTIDYQSLQKDQMTNHYVKAEAFTTKVGLCMSLRNLQWFDSTDPDTFFPRCYRLAAEDDKQAFIDDFRRTACTSLLRYIVERAEGQAMSDRKGSNKRNKAQTKRRIGVGLIETAMRMCQEYLNSLEHCDIDISLEAPPNLSEKQWAKFIHSYYLVIHDGVILEGCIEYAERCQSMLARMKRVCPQLETDGILALVDSNSALINDSKWVVQKYVERPLLIHGTKFDLRQWFLVTDWNPLTVWFYRECYLRFSTQLYSTHNLASSVHLCNNSVQKYFQPSAGRDPSLPAESMWSCGEFRSWLSASGRGGLWEEVVSPGMRRALIQTLLTAQDTVEPRKASFELYGADFLLGSDLKPWLLEINVSPTMACSTAVTARLCPAVQEDTLRVVLDRRSDRNSDTGGFQLIYKQAPVEVPQYLGINLLVEGAQIRRPCSARAKTFTRSHYRSLQKSRRALQTHSCPSGKENLCKEENMTWPPVPNEKLMMEPLLEKRRPRPVLPSFSCPLSNPSVHHHHISHTDTNYTPVRIDPTHTCTHTRKYRTQRHVLSLKRLEPSLEITLNPGISNKGFNHQSTHAPLTHFRQYVSLIQQQNPEKAPAASGDCRRQTEK